MENIIRTIHSVSYTLYNYYKLQYQKVEDELHMRSRLDRLIQMKTLRIHMNYRLKDE